MGVGMYESREFIQQLGGEIRVESEPGKGTTIALYIPVATGPGDGALESGERDVKSEK